MAYVKTNFTNDQPPDVTDTYLNGLEDQVYASSLKLTDLIAGITPTYVGWDIDPTDGANITDGDPTTRCTTGSTTNASPWAYSYFEWDLGTTCHFLCTGIGGCAATVGTGYLYQLGYNNSTWVLGGYIANTAEDIQIVAFGGHSSKVRLGLVSSSAATITPYITEFNVWRLA